MVVRSLALMGAWLVGLAVAGSSESFNIAMQELQHIKVLADNITESVKAWDAGSDDSFQRAFDDIHKPANATSLYVVNATKVLEQHPTTYDITQAFRIGSPAQELSYSVNASIASLQRRKDDFTALSLSSIVIVDLQGLLNATLVFGELLVSYVQEDLQPVANNLQLQIVETLQQGIACFQDEKKKCETAVVDPNRTRKLALEYNAMKPNGYPIV